MQKRDISVHWNIPFGVLIGIILFFVLINLMVSTNLLYSVDGNNRIDNPDREIQLAPAPPHQLSYQ
jgi:hypothetical protein